MSRPRAARVALHGKRMIVTGASPGSLGFEAAKALASFGADLVITTRTASDAAADAIRAAVGGDRSGTARPVRIDAHPLDLARVDSVERFVAWYTAEHGERLDVLVNNAGIHLDLRSQWRAPRLTEDGHEIHLRTNYLGTAHLTHRLLPLLRATAEASGEARVVNVVSDLHTRGRNEALFSPLAPYDSWVAYGVSKLALVHLTFELERRYARERVHAYCLHPGSVFSKIADKGLEESPRLARLRKMLAPLEARILLSPEEGAQTTIHCASTPRLRGGTYYRRCRPAKASDEADEVAVTARLREDTERWVRGLR
jgi:NAD(P)-dependent dehydrogenase (short-subunit alcohol dehydrogenase family)